MHVWFTCYFPHYLHASFLCCGTLPTCYVFHLVCDRGLSLFGRRLLRAKSNSWFHPRPDESASHVPVWASHFHFLLSADKIPQRLGLLISLIGLSYGGVFQVPWKTFLFWIRDFPFWKWKENLVFLRWPQWKAVLPWGLLEECLLPSHIPAFEHLGWNVLFQSSCKCDGRAEGDLAPAERK